MQWTKISDQNQKLDVIEHVNEDHSEELLLVTQTFSDFSRAEKAQILDIFQEGAVIEVFELGEKKKTFVPFQLQDGELEEQMSYLVYLALSKKGKSLGGKKHFFEVLDKTQITGNILRLHIKSPNPLPENSPAYAYWFMLKTLSKLPVNPTQKKKSLYCSRLLNRALLWVMKYLSSKHHRKIIHSMSQGGRYYTLRR